MANNKFDIKVFTDELNKAFTILKKEQVLEKYMKNILLNYNSIIYIGNITDEPNTYNTIYNYMYGEDNTLCNIVIFETDGFVDSATNIIPSGIHIAYPYLDYSVCIDYKYILNINNSAELLTPVQEYKTINNESILGEGNIPVQEPLVSGTNIKTINGQSLLGSGNVPVQEPLVSGTNIKTINNQSLLGEGNIEISGGGGSASKMVNLGTLSHSGTLEANKLQELMTLFQNGDLIQATFVLNGSQFITASAYSNGSSMGIVAYTTVAEFDGVGVVDLSINMANASYTITPIALPSSFKKINDISLIGNGNISVQEPLVSGTNIKTINNQSILDSGNLNLQERLYSGDNIKIINNQSILGAGSIITGLPAKTYTISGISFTKFENGQTTTISASDCEIIQRALLNNATVLYDENLASYLPMLYVKDISSIQILYNDTTGNCGIVSINLAGYTATISMVFNTAPYSSENDINNLSNYELPLTTEKSTELWTNVGTAIQTFNNSSKTESDKATLKEALSIGFGIPFCYLLNVNFIAKYNSHLDNVVNNLTNSSITSEQISQALSYANKINNIITTIGNDATLTSSSQRNQLNTLVNQFCTSLGWSGSNEATFYTITDSAGTTLIRFNKVSIVFPTKKIITLENLYVFMNDLYDSLRNKI